MWETTLKGDVKYWQKLPKPPKESDSEKLSKRPNTSSTWECFSKEDKEKKG
jgi:hypothetical protein